MGILNAECELYLISPKVVVIIFFFIHIFNGHTLFGSFLLTALLPLSLPHLPYFQVELVLPFSSIMLKSRHK
jgi:hypothetical protein